MTDMVQWFLTDCEARVRAFPRFEIPSRPLRDGLSPGNLAQIVFALPDADPAKDINHVSTTALRTAYRHPDEPTGERLWVQIIQRNGTRYVGEVITRAVAVQVRLHQHIEFGPEHVCAWDAS